MTHLPYGGRLDLTGVSKPVRYAGGEYGSIAKKDARLRVVMAFPDVYEVGMSYIGLQIFYGLLNERPDIACERVFSPWQDLEELMRTRGELLRTIETDTLVKDCDIFGITIQHELVYTNFLNLLDMSGLPLRSEDRNEEHPLVITGGPCAYNPAPMAPFPDAFVIGEGEDVLLQICDSVLAAKENQTAREELLITLAQMPGVFVPRFYERKKNRLGYECFGSPKHPNFPEVVHKRIVDFEDSYYPVKQVVPNGRVIQQRLSLEIMRGCPRGCRFCHAGFVDRPVRERSVERLLQITRDSLKETGYDEVSMMSLSSGDYTGAEQLSRCLIGQHENRQVKVSLPSLRLDGFSANIPRELEKVCGGGLTFAPEAGTERLRQVINKYISDQDIFDTIGRSFNKNWESAKLYFMIGLPTETDEDVLAIAELSQRIRKYLDSLGWRRGRVHVSVGTFSPKPHIPFQWYGQIPEEEMRRRIQIIRKAIKHPKIKFNWHDTQPSRLEAALSRGDIRAADAIETAFRKGARFDEWYEHFNDELWRSAFAKHGLSVEAYASQDYEYEDSLPWDAVSININKQYLWREWQRALEIKGTFHCGNEKCRVCGVCDGEDVVTIHTPAMDSEKEAPVPMQQPETIFRYRLAYEKTGTLRFASHQDLIATMDAVIRRANINTVYTRGFHPHPKLVYASALSVGVEGLDEYLDMETATEYTLEELLECLNRAAPSGMHFHQAAELPADATNVAHLVDACRYELHAESPDIQRPAETELRASLRELIESAVLEKYEDTGDALRCTIFAEKTSGNLPSAKRLVEWYTNQTGNIQGAITAKRLGQLRKTDTGDFMPIMPRTAQAQARISAA